MKVDLSREEIEKILDWSPPGSNPLKLRLMEISKAVPPETTRGAMFGEAWERHHKRNGQVFQVAFQTFLSKAAGLDWARFLRNHPIFCEYWDRTGWRYCTETLIDWIDNGMMMPPPEAETAQERKLRKMTERE